MSQGITIIKRPQVIQVKSSFPIFPNFQPFSDVLTENGTTEFTLPAYPLLSGMMIVNIDGVMQDPLNGDFTVNGNTLIINASLVIGQKVAGFFQAMSPDINPLVLNYRSFFFLATAGQTIFNLGFTPQALIYVAINGTLQTVMDQDYTLSGQVLTVSEPLNLNDKLFGLAIQ